MGLDAGYGIGSLKPGVCTSSTRPASPYVGQTIYMTDTDETAVWEGTYWEGLNRGRDRNVVINGAMQVHQRGASTASITTGGYYTADRWSVNISTLGTWTQSVEADAPTGSGLRKSSKMLCTSANASPTGGDVIVYRTFLEGQNVQQFLKGTASAKPFAMSFWVKSNVTGTYIAELRDNDNTRAISASYTISASATWEKKVIIFPADTTGAFDNDNASSLQVQWWLGAGSGFTSGTLSTTWASVVETNRAVGQINVGSAINNYWQVTGVQLEAGAVATPFEFEDYGTTLAKCQRYYYRIQPGVAGRHLSFGANYSTSLNRTSNFLPVGMRIAPTALETTGVANQYAIAQAGIGATQCNVIPAFSAATTDFVTLTGFVASGLTDARVSTISTDATNGVNAYLAWSAEL